MVKKDRYHGFAKTVIGVSHEKEHKVCQDCSGYYANDDGTLQIVAVADGHGEANCFRSDEGARFAVDCALEAVRNFTERYRVEVDGEPEDGEPEREKAIRALVRNVVAVWQEKVEQDYTGSPFKPEELAQCDEKHRKRFSEGTERHKAYGTTLITAAIAGDYWFGFHIGDGRFTVLQEDGCFAQPVPWDERCFLSVTTSICDMSANERPRVYCGQSPPVAIFLCSDGIDDNYPVEGNEAHLYRLYAQMAITFSEDGFDSAREQIGKLCERFAKEGKGDDTSLAVIVDMERIGNITPGLKTRLAQEPAQPAQSDGAGGTKKQTEQALIEAEAKRGTEIRPDDTGKMNDADKPQPPGHEAQHTAVAARQNSLPSPERPESGLAQRQPMSHWLQQKVVAGLEMYHQVADSICNTFLPLKPERQNAARGQTQSGAQDKAASRDPSMKSGDTPSVKDAHRSVNATDDPEPDSHDEVKQCNPESISDKSGHKRRKHV
jgi:serine/threonine protein phosphatase PrpC